MSNKVYFESEEECEEFVIKFYKVIHLGEVSSNSKTKNPRQMFNSFKNQGYIKKSDLEIAREKYTKYYKNAEYSTDEVLIKAIYYIELLEKALEAR